ncbi:glutamine amidotransferase [Longimycelium tulufanense]|uniref:Glutamine amidotransferase n=1 Tax=Longimycelium tulufanense TaxID=907463 RepID=A0A8J3CF11_9PSEU|nr:type 1 glutamine amidotransferase domain-containing protein [Longimycelium tulufanense]GGM69555.1 glutamine amidotransferase [Longimycelium tulufanense]
MAAQRNLIAFLVDQVGIEQVELTDPWQAVQDAGATPRLLATVPDKVRAFHHLNPGDEFEVDVRVSDADPVEYGGLVVPGGVANADKLRMNAHAVRFVRSFVDAGKPVAVICHGAWVLVEADVVRGKTLTSYPSLATDIRNAGGEWVDREVVVGTENGWTLVTSRTPKDLKAFDREALRAFGLGD